MSSWYEPNPAPGLAITSAWGNAVEDAAYPIFATKAALDAQWTGAPDGAHAFVLANRRTYNRRGGQWLLPLETTQGAVVNKYPGPGDLSFVPSPDLPGASMPAFGPFTLYGKRIYVVSARCRHQLLAAVSQAFLGTHLNFTGTGADVPLTWNGAVGEFANGQIIFEAAFPMPWNGAIQQGSWTGGLVTGGTDDQPLAVRAQYVLNGSATPVSIGELQVTCMDVGAAP